MTKQPKINQYIFKGTSCGPTMLMEPFYTLKPGDLDPPWNESLSGNVLFALTEDQGKLQLTIEGQSIPFSKDKLPLLAAFLKSQVGRYK